MSGQLVLVRVRMYSYSSTAWSRLRVTNSICGYRENTVYLNFLCRPHTAGVGTCASPTVYSCAFGRTTPGRPAMTSRTRAGGGGGGDGDAHAKAVPAAARASAGHHRTLPVIRTRVRSRYRRYRYRRRRRPCCSFVLLFIKIILISTSKTATTTIIIITTVAHSSRTRRKCSRRDLFPFIVAKSDYYAGRIGLPPRPQRGDRAA